MQERELEALRAQLGEAGQYLLQQMTRRYGHLREDVRRALTLSRIHRIRAGLRWGQVYFQQTGRDPIAAYLNSEPEFLQGLIPYLPEAYQALIPENVVVETRQLGGVEVVALRTPETHRKTILLYCHGGGMSVARPMIYCSRTGFHRLELWQ